MTLSSISQFTRQCSTYASEFPSSYPYLYKAAHHGFYLGTAIYFGSSLLGRIAILGATHTAEYAVKKIASGFFSSPPLAPRAMPMSSPLRFSGVELGDAYLHILNNQTPTRLSLIHCTSMNDEMMDRIASLIKSNTLTHLTLYYTPLTIAQVRVLAEVLMVNSSLQECCLSSCTSSQEGRMLIVQALNTHSTMCTWHFP